MATFYIQLQDKLLKVNGDVTKENITNALGYVPSDFYGDFDELSNNPIITDETGVFNIVDETGNIIAKFDNKGIHTVEVSASGHNLTEKADKTYVDDEIKSISFDNLQNNPLYNDNIGDLKITDESGNTITVINSNGVESIEFTALESDGTTHHLTEKINKEDVHTILNNLNTSVKGTSSYVNVTVSQKNGLIDNVEVNDAVLSNTLVIEESGEFTIADEKGNIGLKLDNRGLISNDFIANGHVLSKKADTQYVDDKILTLDSQVSGTSVMHGITINVEEKNGLLSNVVIDDNNINFNKLKDNPIIEGETYGEFTIVDDTSLNSIGFVLNSSGAKAKDFITSTKVSLTDVGARIEQYSKIHDNLSGNILTIDERLSDIETLLQEDDDNVINNLKDVIDYFKDVQETETGAALLSTVATHTSNISTLSAATETNKSKINDLTESAVFKEGDQTITGRKTFTLGPKFNVTGDTNAIAIGTDTRFNVLSGDTISDDTVLGMISDKPTLGHEDYETQVRGKKISIGSSNSKTTIQGSDTNLTYNGEALAFAKDAISNLKSLKLTYGISAGKTGTTVYDGTSETQIYIPTSIGHLNSNDTKEVQKQAIESAVTVVSTQGYAKTSDVNKKQDAISDLTTIRNNASSGATAYGWGNHSNAGYAKTSDVNKKQDTISDLATIRSNASSGATAYGWGNHSNAGYAKTSDVNKKQDTISDLATIRNNASSGATAYGWGDHSKKGYLTSSSLNGYAKEDWVSSYVVSAVTGGQVSLDGYATEEFVTSKGYITAQEISNLATKSEVEELTADVVENEYAMSTALNQIIESSGFDNNGNSTLDNGESLTNAIKRLDNACANATEGLKYSTERDAYVTTLTYVNEDGGSENYEITTEQRNYNIETHRKAFNGEICTLNVSGMIYNYIYTMGNITNGSAIFATTDVMKRHIEIQANGDCLYFVEEIQVNLEGYATEDWVTEYVVSAVTGGQVSLDGYATENWVNSKNYLTSSSLNGYAKTSDVNKKQDTISDLATIRNNASSGATAYGWGDHSKKGYLTSASLNGYAKTSDLASYLSKSGGQINGSLIINDESHNHITLTDDGEMYYDAKISYSDGTLGVYSGNRIDILSPISVKSKITVSNEYSGFTCTNLNADLLDGKHASEFMLKTDSVTGSVTYDDIIDAPLVNNDDGEFHITDESNYKIATFNNDGLYTTRVTSINGFFQNSDETLKDFQNEVEVDFARLKNIPKVYYTWKDDAEKTLQIGTSAQKVNEVYPELTTTDVDSGRMVLDYAKLSIIALKAIDTLHEENQLLRKELEELKEKVNTKRTRRKKTE